MRSGRCGQRQGACEHTSEKFSAHLLLLLIAGDLAASKTPCAEERCRSSPAAMCCHLIQQRRETRQRRDHWCSRAVNKKVRLRVRAQPYEPVVVRRRRPLVTERACVESALWEAARRGSRLSAFKDARDRFADGFFLVPLWPTRYARAALLRVRADACPFFGGFSLTPARRALDRPIVVELRAPPSVAERKRPTQGTLGSGRLLRVSHTRSGRSQNLLVAENVRSL